LGGALSTRRSNAGGNLTAGGAAASQGGQNLRTAIKMMFFSLGLCIAQFSSEPRKILITSAIA
jgi:hypothetical protein